MHKRLLGLAVAMTAMFGAAHAQDAKTIGVSIPAADHGWTAGVVYHANRVAELLMKEHPGLNVIVKTSPDPASQANALQDLETQGIDALVILPTDPDPLVNVIKEVKGKGTFVSIVDRAPSVNDATVRDLYVAGNNPALGRVAGEYIAKNTPDAEVVVIRGLPIPIDQQRQDGFDEGIKGSNVKILDRQFGNWNRDDAFKVMQDYLTKYPKIDVVWCQDDDMAVGAIQAIKEAGLKPGTDILVVSIDAVPDIFLAMAAGEANATVELTPNMAGPAFDALEAYKKDGTMPPKWIQTESKLYTQADDPKKVYEEKKGLGY
ncbi:MAG: substrate-binding domain-containing protein [Rhizobiaceae bacterium]|nr:substrate-binding domain-containing protein [Rhizobiaceae bacterium]